MCVDFGPCAAHKLLKVLRISCCASSLRGEVFLINVWCSDTVLPIIWLSKISADSFDFFVRPLLQPHPIHS